MDLFPHRRRISLSGSEWQLALTETPPTEDWQTVDAIQKAGIELLPAQVPGNFELDLQRAGKIPEPFLGLNILDLQRYEEHHLWYLRRFMASPPSEDEDAYLVLEGVDCFADVSLNGTQVGSCDNMLIPHTFSVSSLLRDGPDANELVVHIRPTTPESRQFPYPPGTAPVNHWGYDGLYARKASHMFGWDIFPRAVSGGLWRPVHIEYRPHERLESVYLETREIGKNHAQLVLNFRARTGSLVKQPWEIVIEGHGPNGSTFSASSGSLLCEAGRIQISVSNPHCWWPRDRGEAALYDVTVRLLKACIEVDRAVLRHGIRTVALKRTEVTDARGAGEFCFVINGEPVFIHGANWVPTDAYSSRIAARNPHVLDLTEEINCNMLRCWGGGVYENDQFYDRCDEKGILVWQDFMMACALYPQDEAFAASIEREAHAAISRLRHHACIALWAGDNECDSTVGWLRPGQDPNRNRLTREVLPRVLQQEDPIRPYLPSSPYIGPQAFQVGVDQVSVPEDHLWGPRDDFKSDFYRGSAAHFSSEMGYHGCPSPDSVRQFLTPDQLWPPQDNEAWNLHSTWPVRPLLPNRVQLMTNQIQELFGTVPDCLEDYALASQCVQAEALKFFVEWFRAGMWRRTGILWWNLADGWPQFSDAVVDYYGVKKLAFAYLQTAQQTLHLIVREPASWQQELVVSNLSRESTVLKYSIRDADTLEEIRSGNAKAEGDQVTVLDTIPFSAGVHRFYLIDWISDLYGIGSSHYLAGKPPFDFSVYRRWMQIRLETSSDL